MIFFYSFEAFVFLCPVFTVFRFSKLNFCFRQKNNFFHFQDIFFSIGYAASKTGARDKAIQQAMRVLDIMEVAIDVRPRQFKDKAYPQMVLININIPRRLLPLFFHPPAGTKVEFLKILFL